MIRPKNSQHNNLFSNNSNHNHGQLLSKRSMSHSMKVKSKTIRLISSSQSTQHINNKIIAWTQKQNNPNLSNGRKVYQEQSNSKIVNCNCKEGDIEIIPLLKNPHQTTQLDYSYNKIKSIPNYFAKYQNLQTLNLEHNKITKIQPILLKIQSLKILNLSHNSINVIPSQINKLCNLEKLDLSFNKFWYISQIYPLKQLILKISKQQKTIEINLQGNCLLKTSLKQVDNLLKSALSQTKYNNDINSNENNNQNLNLNNISKQTNQQQKKQLSFYRANRSLEDISAIISNIPTPQLLQIQKEESRKQIYSKRQKVSQTDDNFNSNNNTVSNNKSKKSETLLFQSPNFKMDSDDNYQFHQQEQNQLSNNDNKFSTILNTSNEWKSVVLNAKNILKQLEIYQKKFTLIDQELQVETSDIKQKNEKTSQILIKSNKHTLQIIQKSIKNLTDLTELQNYQQAAQFRSDISNFKQIIENLSAFVKENHQNIVDNLLIRSTTISQAYQYNKTSEQILKWIQVWTYQYKKLEKLLKQVLCQFLVQSERILHRIITIYRFSKMMMIEGKKDDNANNNKIPKSIQNLNVQRNIFQRQMKQSKKSKQIDQNDDNLDDLLFSGQKSSLLSHSDYKKLYSSKKTKLQGMSNSSYKKSRLQSSKQKQNYKSSHKQSPNINNIKIYQNKPQLENHQLIEQQYYQQICPQCPVKNLQIKKLQKIENQNANTIKLLNQQNKKLQQIITQFQKNKEVKQRLEEKQNTIVDCLGSLNPSTYQHILLQQAQSIEELIKQEHYQYIFNHANLKRNCLNDMQGSFMNIDKVEKNIQSKIKDSNNVEDTQNLQIKNSHGNNITNSKIKNHHKDQVSMSTALRSYFKRNGNQTKTKIKTLNDDQSNSKIRSTNLSKNSRWMSRNHTTQSEKKIKIKYQLNGQEQLKDDYAVIKSSKNKLHNDDKTNQEAKIKQQSQFKIQKKSLGTKDNSNSVNIIKHNNEKNAIIISQFDISDNLLDNDSTQKRSIQTNQKERNKFQNTQKMHILYRQQVITQNQNDIQTSKIADQKINSLKKHSLQFKMPANSAYNYDEIQLKEGKQYQKYVDNHLRNCIKQILMKKITQSKQKSKRNNKYILDSSNFVKSNFIEKSQSKII